MHLAFRGFNGNNGYATGEAAQGCTEFVWRDWLWHRGLPEDSSRHERLRLMPQANYTGSAADVSWHLLSECSILPSGPQSRIVITSAARSLGVIHHSEIVITSEPRNLLSCPGNSTSLSA